MTFPRIYAIVQTTMENREWAGDAIYRDGAFERVMAQIPFNLTDEEEIIAAIENAIMCEESTLQ
jgi:hypothetical protein